MTQICISCPSHLCLWHAISQKLAQKEMFSTPQIWYMVFNAILCTECASVAILVFSGIISSASCSGPLCWSTRSPFYDAGKRVEIGCGHVRRNYWCTVALALLRRTSINSSLVFLCCEGELSRLPWADVWLWTGREGGWWGWTSRRTWPGNCLSRYNPHFERENMTFCRTKARRQALNLSVSPLKGKNVQVWLSGN